MSLIIYFYFILLKLGVFFVPSFLICHSCSFPSLLFPSSSVSSSWVLWSDLDLVLHVTKFPPAAHCFCLRTLVMLQSQSRYYLFRFNFTYICIIAHCCFLYSSFISFCREIFVTLIFFFRSISMNNFLRKPFMDGILNELMDTQMLLSVFTYEYYLGWI